MESKLGQRRVEAQVGRALAIDDAAFVKLKAAIEFCRISHHKTQTVSIEPQESVTWLSFIQLFPTLFGRKERAEIAAVNGQLIIKAVGHPWFLFTNAIHIDGNANRCRVDMGGRDKPMVEGGDGVLCRLCKGL